MTPSVSLSVPAPRRAKTKQATLFEEPSPSSDMEAVLASILERLGITAPLVYERQLVPLDQIVIPGRTQLRSVAGYARNIKLVGVLHDPAVMPLTGSPDFLAIFGRHRLAGAHEAGETAIWVRVYPSLDQRIVAFLRLSEQRRRTSHWLNELTSVIEVVDERVALTEDELALSLGVDRRTIRDYLKMARLPFFLRETILGGVLALTTVRQILRMPPEQVQALEEHVAAGEDIDAPLVRQMQQQRYSATLTQIPLAAPTEPAPLPTAIPSYAALLDETRQLLRHLECFTRVVTDAAPTNQSRIALGCRLLQQELQLLVTQAAETGPSAATEVAA